jgi:ATP-dependent RNA helicase DDX35
MAELPLSPMLARALLQSATPEFNCLSPMLSIAAMLTLSSAAFISHSGSEKATDAARRRFAVSEGDHITLYNVYEAFVKAGKSVQFCREHSLNHKIMLKAVSTRNQLAAYFSRFGIAEPATDVLRAGGKPMPERICRCVAAGFFAHVARMKADGSFVTVDGKTTLWAHPSSVFFHRKVDWVVYSEIMETRGKVYIRDLASVEMEWLVEYAPEVYKIRDGR